MIKGHLPEQCHGCRQFLCCSVGRVAYRSTHPACLPAAHVGCIKPAGCVKGMAAHPTLQHGSCQEHARESGMSIICLLKDQRPELSFNHQVYHIPCALSRQPALELQTQPCPATPRSNRPSEGCLNKPAWLQVEDKGVGLHLTAALQALRRESQLLGPTNIEVIDLMLRERTGSSSAKPSPAKPALSSRGSEDGSGLAQGPRTSESGELASPGENKDAVCLTDGKLPAAAAACCVFQRWQSAAALLGLALCTEMLPKRTGCSACMVLLRHHTELPCHCRGCHQARQAQLVRLCQGLRVQRSPCKRPAAHLLAGEGAQPVPRSPQHQQEQLSDRALTHAASCSLAEKHALMRRGQF